jgi:hypothetical protein
VVRATVPLRGPVEKILELAGGDSTSLDLTLPETNEADLMPASEPSSPPWVLWGLTGALIAGTSVTGVLALGASSASSDVRNNGGSFADYQSDQQRMRTFSLTTDILGGVTIVVAGLATYLTLARGPKKAGSASPVLPIAAARSGSGLSFTF